MRVLLSAYACEPNRGSEPEIGWQRVLHMLEYADEVWVLTRSNNRSPIEAAPQSSRRGLNFIYFDLPGWIVRLKKKRLFFNIYLVLWQWGAYRITARIHREMPFDRVYHVTFGSMLSGSFMGRLKVPFIVGPIAGGERAPFRLRRNLSWRCRAFEFLRDMGIVLQRYSPLTQMALASAERIYVTTPESLKLVLPKWHGKTSVRLAVAIEETQGSKPAQRPSGSPRFLFAGRLLGWKGAHLAIRALAQARSALPGATLSLVGTGPDQEWLKSIAHQSRVADSTHFLGQMPRERLLLSLGDYTALVFPSLHDSGGFVVLEALAAGLPVICLDLGGPGIMINESCGIVVSTSGADEAQVVNGIAKAMISIASMPATGMEALSAGAIARAKELSWTNLTACIMGDPGRGAAEPIGEAAESVWTEGDLMRSSEPSRNSGFESRKRTDKG